MKKIAKPINIRIRDLVVVFGFFNPEDVEPFGTRGITIQKDEMKEIMSELIDKGELVVEIKDTPETTAEKLVKKAYDEYLDAKKSENGSEVVV